MNNRNYRSKSKKIKKNQLKRQLCLFIMTVVILFISCAYFGNILSSAQDRNNNLNNLFPIYFIAKRVYKTV